jgi:hypothetical protein
VQDDACYGLWIDKIGLARAANAGEPARETTFASGENQMYKPIQKISPFLWFDHQAEEAVGFCTSIFKA